MAFVACSSDEEQPGSNERRDIAISHGEAEMVRQNNDFALRLVQAIQDGSSQVVSPLSATLVLAMINNGADGETRQEICRTMGFNPEDMESANCFCRKLLSEAPGLDRQVTLRLAGNIFVNKEHTLLPGFLNTVKDYYGVVPEEYDFNNSNTLEAINRWGREHTEGRITEVLDKLAPNDVCCLLSAVYFNGMWKDKFLKDNTQKRTFHDGMRREVSMMQRIGKYEIAENDTLQLLQLPYGNEAFMMSVMLPREEVSLDSMLQIVNGNMLDSLRKTMTSKAVEVWLPTFETRTQTDLAAVLSHLGMPKAFSVQAEFPALSATPSFISVMRQCSTIKVSEEGAEAASATAAVQGETENIDPFRALFHADRPFVYFISEKSTGTILFIGSYHGD
jgi:serpin B